MMVPPKIIVTGGNGQLGNELRQLADSYPQYEFIFFSREEFSIDNEDQAKKLFGKLQPAFLINAAAYTAVDKAESEKEKAFEINGTAVGVLARLCREFQVHFIHISTDYVFNGRQSQPLKETDPVDPLNTYGASKLKGEELAFLFNSDTVVIRTSWVYSRFGKNFVKTMVRLMQEKNSINVVNDQWGSPTHAADLAEAILQIIGSEQWVPGVYNFSNEGVITWFDFALEIKRLIHSGCEVKPITTEQFPTSARRPKYSVLDKTSIQSTYKIRLKNWKESLASCIAQLNVII